MTTHPTAQRFLGTMDLLADGIEHGSRTVERSQRSVSRRLFSLVGTLTGRDEQARRYESLAWLVLGAGHRNVRAVSRLTSMALDAAHHLAEPALRGRGQTPALVPLRSDVVGSAPWLWDGFVGIVNGVVGDHLVATTNPLAIQMSLRESDRPSEAPTKRLCVFIHGLTTTEWSWAWEAEKQHGQPDVTYGSLLSHELGFRPLYVRYNSGLHISDNGRALADLLEAYVQELPEDIEELALVGHSMGGLVAHSAAHYGREAGHSWLPRLRHVVSIAAPHDGAPLEKLGNLATTILGSFDTPGTRIPAEVIDARSAGIKDLGHGYVVEEDWRDADPDQLLTDGRTHRHWVDGVRYHRVVATLTEDPAHPMGRLVGDAMVRPSSAAASNLVHAMGQEPGELATVGGISHIGLANHPRIYQHIKAWLSD